MKPLLIALAAMVLVPLWAQEDDVSPEIASKPPVEIVFTPPDLEGRVVLGIFDNEGKLLRTLEFEQDSPELKIDTNGYIAQWDGLDDAGKPCAAGRYSARGFVVGEEVAVEGEAFHFNDWVAEDHISAQDVSLSQWPDGIGVKLKTPTGEVFERIQPDGSLAATLSPAGLENSRLVPPDFLPAPLGWSAGRDGTTWLILDLDGQHVVVQFGKDKASMRELRVPMNEPQPVQVLASPTEDAILIKEVGVDGLQRVRMLRRGEAETEKDGRVTADWEVVFERSLQPCAKFGVVDGKLVADAGDAVQKDSVEVKLVKNALAPGDQKLRLKVVATNPGSALASPDGLKLIEISSQGEWRRFALAGAGAHATLYQGNGLVVEEFAVRNMDHIAAFDAGTFLLAAP